MERAKIYAIMCFTKLELDEKTRFPDFGSTATMGFYMDKDVAFDAVRSNGADINETCYDYALVEEVEEGLYPASTTRWFFKFNKDTGKYEDIPEPDFVKHVCGLIM